ncbi:hypothetical protein FACHB389_35285 [Nostoc calcicola FACHB-389]|nr:hypothetical protein FACHB389_35285 [Nostoc calcicola FACHB-389]
MLTKFEASGNTSPFQDKTLQTQSPSPTTPKETNRARTFRRAGNACEIVAGACLNSAVVFTFHLLQAHPAGMVLAVGTSHFYFTATAAGEREVSNIMSGFSASLAVLCALSEPLGEWWEAESSKNAAQAEIRQMYPQPAEIHYPSWLSGLVIASVFFLLRLSFTHRSRNGVFKR